MARRSTRFEALAMAIAALASAPAMADDRVVGEWITASQSARVAIAGCADNPALLCGRIAWLARPQGADGRPVTDSRNPDANLRGRPLLGIDIIRGFRAAGPDRWKGGTIYDPESGRTYDAQMRLSGPGALEVKGCVLIFCEAQIWRRAPGVRQGRRRPCHRRHAPPRCPGRFHGLAGGDAPVMTQFKAPECEPSRHPAAAPYWRKVRR